MPVDHISHLVAPRSGESQGQRRSFYRTFIQFISSNLGLVIVVVAYSIGGAFLFILLEQYIELQNCQQGSLSENISIENISESIYNYVTISTDNITVIYDEILSYLGNFTDDVYQRKNDYRYTGQDCDTTSGWTFPSALLFTITVITSIGYGHITPVSWEGQITCICYALIGIPIFLLCLTNISSILGDMFRFLYTIFLRFMCCCCRIYMRSRRRRRKGPVHGEQHGMNYVGTTSIDPNWPEANHQCDGEKLSDDGYDNEEENEEELDDVWTRMEGRVPIVAVILIIIGYIGMGAFMFSKSEGWSMVISVYFCYITLATIGFGDYVPGITASSTDGLRFLAACLYIIVGLAVLAMCFDLIKESIVDKFEWIAHRFGIVGEDDGLIDEERTKYANFEYSQQHEINDKSLENKNESYESPPAYDDTSGDGQWLKGIKDKAEPTTNFQTKQRINLKDDKY